MRFILILMLAFAITGCSWVGKFTKEPVPDIEYVEVPKPISVTPMPPDTACPDTPLSTMSPEAARSKSDGEIAKVYLVSALMYDACSELREKVIDKYRDMAERDARNIERLKDRSNGPQSAGSPFSAGGPVVNPGSGNGPKSVQPYSFPADALESELQNNPFEDIEDEFKDLERKEYRIE